MYALLSRLRRRGHTNVCDYAGGGRHIYLFIAWHLLYPRLCQMGCRKTGRNGWIYFITGDIARCLLSYFAKWSNAKTVWIYFMAGDIARCLLSYFARWSKAKTGWIYLIAAGSAKNIDLNPDLSFSCCGPFSYFVDH